MSEVTTASDAPAPAGLDSSSSIMKEPLKNRRVRDCKIRGKSRGRADRRVGEGSRKQISEEGEGGIGTGGEEREKVRKEEDR